MDDYERVLLVKPDVQVYRIPPRATNRAYRASEWNLDAPDWSCRLRLIAKGSECYIKLDEKTTGQFFGQCPIEKYPGAAIEAVSDSSRYFVLKLVNEQSGRTAFVGVGFVDRSDSFDLNVALQDHFKILQMESDASDREPESETPKLDLGFKEGQTIKVNLNIGNKASSAKTRPAAKGATGILLPPPPLPPPGVGKIGGGSNLANKITSAPDNGESHSTNGASSSRTATGFHQQLLDGLQSLSVNEPKEDDTNNTDSSSSSTTTTTNTTTTTTSTTGIKGGFALWTPANSVCDDGAFDTFESIAAATTKPSSSNVISVKNGQQQNCKKSDDDLWSEFESFRNANSNSGNDDGGNRTSETSGGGASNFEDWAKF